MDTIRPETSRPAPYRPAQRREWIVCDEPGIEGFAILVRTSITNGEQAQLQAEIDEITGPYTDQWFTRPPEERDVNETPRMKERELLARLILDWNVTGETADGEVKEIAPPAVNGAAAFDLVEKEAVTWMFLIVFGGYLQTGKVEPSLTRLIASGGLSVEDPVPEIPEPSESAHPTS
jgi:hypothetical protein